MFLEIFIGIVLGLILVYLFILYLEWGDTYNKIYALHKLAPGATSANDKAVLESYSWALPPLVVSDGYKYVNFWLNYYITYVSMTS